jgi:phosphatidylglycerol:prolipoprotein diacylglycerol transferase
MIPYFRQPSLSIGPVTLYAFGSIVAVAVLMGAHRLLRRIRDKGLDETVGEDLLIYLLIPGFAVSHIYSVLAYYPDRLVREPLLLLKFWENISSFGGFLGGALGTAYYFVYRAPRLDAETRWKYVDAVAFVFPFAWTIGRLACTVAHDHPGIVTSFPLAVSLESYEARSYILAFYESAGRLRELPPADVLARMGFHDLGWYEFLYCLLVLVPVFLVLDRKGRPAGFFLGAFLLLYSPVRFGLDALRLEDARYAGLTPGQYGALAGFLAGLFLLWKRRA